MDRPDHNTYREWLYLEADGGLSPDQQARLESHLAGCLDCRRERQEFAAFGRLLAESRIPVRPDFRARVLAALPAAGWEARHPRAWRLPAAVVLLLAGVAAVLTGLGASEPVPAGLSALAALAGMFEAAVLAGAGLLAASWKGVGMALGEVVASPAALVAFAILVLCLNLLLLTLIRRRKPVRSEAAVPARAPGDRGGSAAR